MGWLARMDNPWSRLSRLVSLPLSASTALKRVRSYPCHLLRRSFRDEQGRPRKETLANLSALPPEAIDALRLSPMTLPDFARDAIKEEYPLRMGVAALETLLSPNEEFVNLGPPGHPTWFFI
jgi:hypothetical protein